MCVLYIRFKWCVTDCGVLTDCIVCVCLCVMNILKNSFLRKQNGFAWRFLFCFGLFACRNVPEWPPFEQKKISSTFRNKQRAHRLVTIISIHNNISQCICFSCVLIQCLIRSKIQNQSRLRHIKQYTQQRNGKFLFKIILHI